MNKGHVSPEMFAGRVSVKGKVTDLSAGFKIKSNNPLALFIIPRADGANPDAAVAIVDCKLYQDDNFSDCPFATNCWDAPAVREIGINGINLADFDVYWGAGADVEES